LLIYVYEGQGNALSLGGAIALGCTS